MATKDHRISRVGGESVWKMCDGGVGKVGIVRFVEPMCATETINVNTSQLPHFFDYFSLLLLLFVHSSSSLSTHSPSFVICISFASLSLSHTHKHTHKMQP